MAAWQQASAVLVALVQALLRVEGPEGMLDEADEQRLGTCIVADLPVRPCRLSIHIPVQMSYSDAQSICCCALRCLPAGCELACSRGTSVLACAQLCARGIEKTGP